MSNILDDDLCTAEFPGDEFNAGQLCDQLVGHDGDHRCLTEIAFNYRRHLAWTADGRKLPDIEVIPDA